MYCQYLGLGDIIISVYCQFLGLGDTPISYYQYFEVGNILRSIYGQGEQDTAELATNIDANHTCTKFVRILFWQIFFFLMLSSTLFPFDQKQADMALQYGPSKALNTHNQHHQHQQEKHKLTSANLFQTTGRS